MGSYLNPGNSGFSSIRNDIYIDKSGLISLVNEIIETPRRLACVSRPRRFGKSFAAQMLCAYYDRECNSSALFANLEIARNPKYADSYRQHLNRYNLIYRTIQGNAEAVAEKIEQIRNKMYPEVLSGYGGEALLAGIAYDKEAKDGKRKHSCMIEKAK